ncbi:autotransporter-associated beta strand repeat-containing protein [Luteolibacter ambystomatis]|uniref:Autotransporter-associated beta strand repeat-containing protein n=1 Tax=Luteolibacter ambystomatis TaxID=2824561 RepID=A0A975IY54_9BACT|nr:autotransporter-associated beta strand repeat-containing protein [Luteolibacter ambystomatis]QUE49528.1 autotransporter-associated beta strand repeat-containing protein [Luteolibacter ambystomatis]
MKQNSSLRASLLHTAAALALLPTLSHAAETVVNATTANIVVNAGDSVWFDSNNTNAAISLGTINGATPATGPLPGWAHTRWSFLKYTGTQVVEIPNGEKVLGAANLGTATATSTYYDNGAATTLASNQSIGNVETTRDFLISNGATLNVANGGLLFHNASHWMKVGTGSGFVTSSSGTLTIVANGGSTDYQVNNVVIKDYDGSTPLKVIKTGPDHLRFSVGHTYTGGTWVNNGRLALSSVGSLGTGMARVTGTNSQLDFAVAGAFPNALQIEGLGWAEGTEQRGAIRFEGGANLTGAVTLTGAARITANGGQTGTISGALSGTANLEVGIPTTTADLTGTVNITGNASAYTGTINVTRGRLNLNTTLGGSANVSDGFTLGAAGTINGNLTVGGTTGANLSINTASPLTVAGTVTFNGASKIVLPQLPPNGTYPLVSYGGLFGPANVSIDGSIYRKTVALDTSSPGVINLTVSGSGLPLVWTGATTGNWDVNVGANWSAGAGNITFLQGDDVLFDDTSAVNTIALTGLLQPSSVTFNNTTATYTLNGFNNTTVNGIIGTTGITKNGTGLVNFGGQSSTFTGPVQVNAGTLKVLNAEAFGFTSGITIAAGGAIDFNGQQPGGVGHPSNYTIAGNGVDGLGALANSGGAINEGAGVRALTLSADASLNANIGRFDIGHNTANPGNVGTITGNNHTLTLNAGQGIGVRGDSSGTPIHYVIASGRAWAELTDNALGGLTGDVVVKNGARLGTYNPRTIATPVSIESGGTLYVEGAGGVGTWTGAITLAGAVTFEAAGQALVVNGPVTGTASLTKTGGNTATVAQPGYVGDTTVSEGTLSLGAATLADTSTVNIAAGGKLTLTHGQTDTVAGLVIGGVTMASGTYGATGSGATNIDDAHFAGTGRLSVASAGSYAAWALSHGVGAANADDDHDGITNGIEFVIGGDPAAPGDQALLPFTAVNPADITFSFFRTVDSANYNPAVQYSTNLTSWTTAVDGVDGVTVVTDNNSNPPIVTVTVPRSLASPATRFFVRLQLTVP